MLPQKLRLVKELCHVPEETRVPRAAFVAGCPALGARCLQPLGLRGGGNVALEVSALVFMELAKALEGALSLC